MNFLDLAADLATKIDPHIVAPNPRVGCIVVKDGKIIGQGVHEKFGGEHAEVNAIKDLENINYCEIYITLEPCDIFPHKKTPSCTDLLIQKTPKKIIVGSLDPKFGGRNLEKIKKAGIEVEMQLNEKCNSLNPFLEKFVNTGLPYVTVKLAQSLDGKITGPSRYISNEFSRKKVHEMRAQYSAILTTTETILQDDPSLDCRLDGSSNPDLIVVGEREIPKKSKIFSIPNRNIHFFKTHNLEEVLEECGKKGIDSIMTECGATVCTDLLQKNLIDEIQLFIAPEIFGKGKNSFTKEVDLTGFKLVDTKDIGGDVFVKFTRQR
ncbi:bifunctional diaminohydroxyphosphoribosylaminopyrimidine deaminase/5-amino-6-(5-phosphoribosylamino)uracil reductase RibD [Candidatus Gracilibacteria bacterium]|nr:bifunctional diaminohydroxyphosphoribosylaminopyrimidine deaminase/5-amino-6-(5-phosphoribosylamino)uracil reductase RibD [Candidatus Gracilibacteria bacterium]